MGETAALPVLDVEETSAVSRDGRDEPLFIEILAELIRRRTLNTARTQAACSEQSRCRPVRRTEAATHCMRHASAAFIVIGNVVVSKMRMTRRATCVLNCRRFVCRPRRIACQGAQTTPLNHKPYGGEEE